jgi:hypothetical protein
VQLAPASLHAHRPSTHSIDPQHSMLDRQPPRAAVQQRRVPSSVAQTSVPQHCASVVQAAVLPGARHAVVGGRQRLPVHVKPGQQSVLDAQLSSSRRHAQ